MGIVHCCWKPWWMPPGFGEPATGPPTGSTLGRPPDAVAWTGSTKATVKPSKTSTFTRWSAMPDDTYAAIPPGKQIQTQASRLGVSVRSVTRARNELLEEHWICLPSGDSGGRAFSKETWLEPRGQAARIHLHPDGQPCGMQQSELKQRVAASRRKR